MNLYAWVLLTAICAAAVADWFAVARRERAVEVVAKPAVLVLLLAFAWLLHAEETGSGRWLVAGLVLCLVGDVSLMARSERAFRLGLLAFLLGHLAYLAMVLALPRAEPLWAGVAATVLVTAGAVRLLLRSSGARGGPDVVLPVAYALVIGAFVASAWWSGNRLLAVGASAFLVSDGVLAADRFWRPLPRARVVVMVTYHVAQILIVVGSLRPDLSAMAS